MRVNIYAEEMTRLVQIISKEIEGRSYTGLRLWLHLPTSYRMADGKPVPIDSSQGQVDGQLQGPFMHHPEDDDSSAVTFWGKRDLRETLILMIEALDAHYGNTSPELADYVLRTNEQDIGEALTDYLGSPDSRGMDWYDARNVDDLIQAVRRHIKGE